MSKLNQSLRAQCKCGSNTITIKSEPLMRTVCHCRFCQEYTGRDKSDFVIYRNSDVELPPAEKSHFRAFKKPQFVSRGTCTSCGGPAYEHVRIPLLPNMVIIPVPNHEQTSTLPAPSLHMFYHRRKADVNDPHPKYSNPLNSEWQFISRLIGALFFSSR